MQKLTWRIGLLIVIVLTAIACRPTTVINLPNDPTPTPTPAPVVLKHTIQFRAQGNASSVRIRYSTPVDGLGQVVTSLPYFQTFTIAGDAVFLSLEATPISYGYAVIYPFLSIQITVDNVVFREATSADFILAPLATSGQWRQ
jgi:hypothetical protein